tara:strand:- start:1198 stop:2073 length:876 start_codon:yes stop_codon:yes gene_type:complete
MDSSDLLKKIRKIEIKAKGLSNHIFSGEYQTAFKGKGMAFSEVREYQHGDDIRAIDWNVTARYNSPYIKIFEEEREMTVILLVDISKSGDFGTTTQSKRDLTTEISAVLAFSAINNNDKVGVIFFSDKIEKFIPPAKGKTHILRIIREVLTLKPQSTGTNICTAIEYFNNVIKKRSVLFMLSDFMDNGFEKPLRISSKKHDVVAIHILDKRERELPQVGILPLKDTETGKIIYVDTSDDNLMASFSKKREKFNSDTKNLFKICGSDYISILTGSNYSKSLINFFKSRSLKK